MAKTHSRPILARFLEIRLFTGKFQGLHLKHRGGHCWTFSRDGVLQVFYM